MGLLGYHTIQVEKIDYMFFLQCKHRHFKQQKNVSNSSRKQTDPIQCKGDVICVTHSQCVFMFYSPASQIYINEEVPKRNWNSIAVGGAYVVCISPHTHLTHNTLCDFFLFPHMERGVTGHRSDNFEEVKNKRGRSCQPFLKITTKNVSNSGSTGWTSVLVVM